MTTLLTGGVGFIGSHMAAHLLSVEVKFIVVDNLSNVDKTNLEKLSNHFNRDIKKRLKRKINQEGH